MKIHDIILKEEFLNWRDLGAWAKSMMSNVGKPGWSWQDVKDAALRDRAVQVAVDAFIKKWKATRYNYFSNYGKSYEKLPADKRKSFDDALQSLLERIVWQEIGASHRAIEVLDGIKTIFNAGDRLNSNAVNNAATSIIVSGVANAMRLTIAPDSEEDLEKLNKKQQQVPQEMDYGKATKTASVLTAPDPTKFIPVIVVNWQPTDGSPPGRFVKLNNVWYLDLSDRSNLIHVPPSAHVGQKTNDRRLQFAAQNAQRYAEVQWAGGVPPENWIVNFVGIQPTQTPRVYRLPPPNEQAEWKAKTGRAK